MAQSTRSTVKDKPSKPHKDFPLFPHATGRWAKKIRGKLCYFGPWADANAALQKWLDQKDDLLAGRTPRAGRDGLTIRELVNRFLTSKKHLVDTSELSARMFSSYFATCERLINAFGRTRLVIDLATDDFEKLRASLAKTRGPVALGNEVQKVRILFKYGFDAGLIDRPVRFGPTFKRPSKRVLRVARHAKGERMFEASDVRKLLKAASVPLRAMILLGINCGFGNTDVSRLPKSALELTEGWVNYPRPKTAIPRRVPLWPETIKALRSALSARPQAAQTTNDGLVFVTKYGHQWVRFRERVENYDLGSPEENGNSLSAGGASIDGVAQEFGKLLRMLKLVRPGLGFYALRHSFETIGGETRDQVAVNQIMGHADASMSAVYRERISDDRLRVVANHVRKWLFGESGNQTMGIATENRRKKKTLSRP